MLNFLCAVAEETLESYIGIIFFVIVVLIIIGTIIA